MSRTRSPRKGRNEGRGLPGLVPAGTCSRLYRNGDRRQRCRRFSMRVLDRRMTDRPRNEYHYVPK